MYQEFSLSSLNKPPVYESVEQTLFSQVRELGHPPFYSGRIEWHKHISSNGNMQLFEAIEPLNNILLETEKARFGKLPESIRYATEVHDAKPKKALGSYPYWHTDYLLQDIGCYLISDCSPTEYLVASRQTLRTAAEKIIHLTDVVVNTGDETENEILYGMLDEAGLKIFTPEPLAVAALDNYVHRSPSNKTDTVVSRMLIRAEVYRSE